ncbi:MAG: hypothetical protein AAF694_15480 [Bacteroidota bacterium]
MKKITLVLCFLCCTLAFSVAQSVEKAMKKLEWRAIGPANMGGRVTDIDGIPGDPSTFYISGADGGVFKTTNGGTTFESLFTKQRAYSVGALTIAPSDHNVIWLGSGEGDPRNSVGYGNGVYRSIDGGQSWEHIGLDNTERIKRIVVHPNDPDVACVCALGREWGPNTERGVFKTIDGGKNWEHVLSINEDTGCSDIAMDLSNPRIMYAGMWTFRRKPWRFDDGGKETAVYRTKDGGKNWEKIMNGLPDMPMARPGLAVAQSQPNTVYLITEFKDTGMLYRSDDRGNSWKMVNKDPNINFRPFYYSDIRVDPNNPDVVYSLSGRLVKSTDGGKNFDVIARNVHGDHQSLWIDPMNSNRVLSGSDGGFQVSVDAGKTWDIINNVELSQFYQLDVDNLQPYNVYGGLQDNGCWVGPSNSLNAAGIMKRHWKRLSYGDGYYAIPIPGSEHEVYTNLQGGVPFHVNGKTGVVRSIHPYPKITGSAGDAIENHKYRFNWDSPLHISPHDPNTVYFGGNVLFKSTDRGHTWEEISPDLTTNDKDKQRTSGGEIYQDNTAAEFHCSILYIAESPVQKDVIWVGTDDGRLHVTKDGGDNWTDLSSKVTGMPTFAWIGKIHASEHDAGTAFLAIDQHRMDDFRPYAFMTTDFGQTWKKITQGLPADDYVKVVRQDPKRKNVLVLGMEHGVYMSHDMGGSWERINNNLPPVSVRDLRIHPREGDIIVGTHGRGVWILDDAWPVSALDEALNKSVHLFNVRPTIRWHAYQQIENLGTRVYRAQNPTPGAYVNFYLREKPKEAVTLTLKDGKGAVLRTLEDSTAGFGINRMVWDLRGKEAVPFAGAPRGGWRSGRVKPYVPPGTYTAVLKAGGETLETQIKVLPDPRLDLSQADYVAQAQHTAKLRDILNETHTMLNQMDAMHDQLKAVKQRIQSEQGDHKALLKEVDQVLEELVEQRNELTRPAPAMSYRQRPRLREEILSQMYATDGAPAKPTGPQAARATQLTEEKNEAAKQFKTFMDGPVKALNQKLEGMPAVAVKEEIGS